MTRGMFFGRFQPLHRGHLEVARTILEKHDEIIFMIGMSTESHTPRNPFTAGERIEMIRLSSIDMGFSLDRIITVTLPTMEVHVADVYDVVHMAPKFDEIYVGNKIMARIFRESGIRVTVPKPYKREIYNASYIRSLMAKGDPKWRELVTPRTASFIEKIGGPERIREITDENEEHTLHKEGI